MINDQISIIIVNYNGKSHLEKCLESLSKITYENTEIIIIDNNSSDGSIEFLEKNYPHIKTKKLEKNLGFAYPNNIGAKIANGDLLLFLNNDTIVTPNFLVELVKTINSNPTIAICQSFLLKPDNTIDSSGDFVDTLGRAFSSRIKQPVFQKILSARGASMLMKKEIFFKLGGFDENFFVSFEDVDLGWRANIAGYDVVLSPKSLVYHLGSQTIKNLNNEVQFHGVKNSLIIRLTNFELLYSIKSIMILFFISTIRKLFKISLIQDPETPPPLPSMKNIFFGSFWIIKNLNYIYQKRKQIKKIRKKSTKDLIKLNLIKNYDF